MTLQQVEHKKKSGGLKNQKFFFFLQNSHMIPKHRCLEYPKEVLQLLWDGYKTYDLVILWQRVKLGDFHIFLHYGKRKTFTKPLTHLPNVSLDATILNFQLKIRFSSIDKFKLQGFQSISSSIMGTI